MNKLDDMLNQLKEMPVPEKDFVPAEEFKQTFFAKTKKSKTRFRILAGTLAASLAALIAVVTTLDFEQKHTYSSAPELPEPSAELPEPPAPIALSAPKKAKTMRNEFVLGESANCICSDRAVITSRIMQAPERMPRPEVHMNTEEYRSYEENPFLEVLTNPLSTFGADVDTAGYANVRRMLQYSKLPPRDAVRTEEFLNYFRYDYAAPKENELFNVQFEMMDAPWADGHKLLLVGVQAKNTDVSELPPSNFVFLIDNSGSMHEEMELVRESMRMLAEKMRPQDKISVVTYGGGVNVLAEAISGSEPEKLQSLLKKITSGGYTPGGEGIQTAYRLAHTHYIKGGNNRIVLITDGDFNVGASSESELVAMVEKERKSGIYLTAIGVGQGNYKDSKMKMLANKGNGNYVYLDNLREARNVMVNEMSGRMFTLAKDVKFQIEFNPEKIHSYRQIGYEMRKLNDRDFNDDTKDAGEVGVGHQVTVLYELVPADGKQSSGVDALKYLKKAVSGNPEILTCKMRYQLPEGDAASVKREFVLKSEPEASGNIRWASAVAEFALILRDSEYKGKADIHTLRQRAQPWLGKDPDGSRAEFLTLIRNAEDLVK